MHASPNKTPALAQEWAVWSETTWDLSNGSHFVLKNQEESAAPSIYSWGQTSEIALKT